MKKQLFILSLFVLAMSSCSEPAEEVSTDMLHFPSSSDSNADKALPEITFENTTYEFGKIFEGEIVEYSFDFKNTGDAPLVLTAVEPSCGCTVPKNWPKTPLAPGATGTIIVEFDSHQRVGKTNKNIAVVANTSPSKSLLFLKGEVLEAPQLMNE